MATFDGVHTIYEGDVQYPYADVGAPKLLHISGVTAENRRAYNYECPCCHKRLRPVLARKTAIASFTTKAPDAQWTNISTTPQNAC